MIGLIMGSVSLNAQVRIGQIEAEGSEIITTDQIIDFGIVRPGLNYTKKDVISTNGKIAAELQFRGYLFGRIDSVSVIPIDSNTVDLLWHIYDGSIVRIGSMNLVSEVFDRDLIYAQLDLSEGEIYNQALIESEILRINELYAQRGHPFANLNIASTSLERIENEFRVNIDFAVDPGDTVKIENIQIGGNNVTRDNVILRELDVNVGDLYDQDKINQIPNKLNRLGFFKNIEQPQLMIDPSGQRTLFLEVLEGNTTTFDGVVGYVPPSKVTGGEDGYFTGLINLSFRNLFGTGRKFEVYWRKQDRYSDEFRLYYQEPWIFGFPLNVGGGLYRLVRDTTYIERSYDLDGLLRISSNFNATFSVQKKSFTPDSVASREQRLAQNDIYSGEIGIIYDTRDFPINPREGLYYDTYYSFGYKENTGPDYLFSEDGLTKTEEIQRIKIGLSYFQSLWQNQVLAFRFFGGRVEGSKDQLQLTDHFWFGGARTVRGYREDQFHGTTVSYVNMEYRFLTGRESRIYLFNDWGFYNFKTEGKVEEDIVPGYGIGVRFMTPLGIMSVDYGLGKNDTFSTGKIHIGIVNSF
jgi:outer membrane protein insertion porin family